jgi:ribonuclease P protein component
MSDDLFIDTQAFPRPNRLTHAADYDRVFKNAQRSGDPFFTVLYCRNDLGYSRLGLAIAKKRVRRAVARNRLKRIIRDSFRHAKSQLLGVDIVIMARDETEQALNRDLFASLEQHWRAVARANRT